MNTTRSQPSRSRSLSAALMIPLLVVLRPQFCRCDDVPSSAVATASAFRGERNRPKVALRAGVLHAPPFAVRESDGKYSGFQPDLLERLRNFASDLDGVDVTFELSDAPKQYGSALDLVANDCNTTENPLLAEECDRFDIIVGDFYVNKERSKRVNFSPAWLKTTLSTMKFVERRGRQFDTLLQLEAAEGTACVPGGTYLADVVIERYPGAFYYICSSPADCVDMLKNGTCALYVDDELFLRHWAISDTTLEVNRENFQSQYIVWPLRKSLPFNVSQLLSGWLYAATANATLDELYYTYFEVKTCPFGTAGENCDKYCDPKHGQADREGVCVCESTRWMGDDCSVERMVDLNLIPHSLKVLGYTFYGINVAVAIGCGLWLHKKRTTQQVKVVQPYFLRLMLLGCMVSSSTIVALAQEDAGDGPVPACVVVPWLYSVGFCITFGTLFAKIRRVHRLFKSAARMQRVRVTATETLLQIGAILFVDVVILSVWTGVDPLHWVRTVTLSDQYGDTLSSQGYCTSEHWPIFITLIAALHFGLLIIACYMCYVTRHIPAKFSEGQYLSLAMLSNFQIFLIGIPVLVIVGVDSASSFFVRSAIIFINDLAVMGLVFGNLIYSVRTHRGDISTRTAIRSYKENEDASITNLSNHSVVQQPHHVLKASKQWEEAYGFSNKRCSSQLSDDMSYQARKGSLDSLTKQTASSKDQQMTQKMNHQCSEANTDGNKHNIMTSKQVGAAYGSGRQCNLHVSDDMSRRESLASTLTNEKLVQKSNPRLSDANSKEDKDDDRSSAVNSERKESAPRNEVKFENEVLEIDSEEKKPETVLVIKTMHP